MFEFWKWYFGLPIKVQIYASLVPMGIYIMYLWYKELEKFNE